MLFEMVQERKLLLLNVCFFPIYFSWNNG